MLLFFVANESMIQENIQWRWCKVNNQECKLVQSSLKIQESFGLKIENEF